MKYTTDLRPTETGLMSLPSLATRQEGIVLFVAIIVLVVMTLASIALVRSVDTGTMVAGNLAFKQGGSAAGDAGTAAAMSWLATEIGTTTLYDDQPADGYYATSQDSLDITGTSGDPGRALVDWHFNSCNNVDAAACILPAPTVSAGGGYTVTYIIHRLCRTAGDPNSAANSCANYQSRSSKSPKRGELKYGEKRFEPGPVEYFRVTSRVSGPRNTVSFVETIVHF